MKIVPLAQAKAQLSACVDEAATHGPIIITRNGKAAAVLWGPATTTSWSGWSWPTPPGSRRCWNAPGRASRRAEVYRTTSSGGRWRPNMARRPLPPGGAEA